MKEDGDFTSIRDPEPQPRIPFITTGTLSKTGVTSPVCKLRTQFQNNNALPTSHPLDSQ